MIRKMQQSDITQVAQIERECFSLPWSENSLQKEVDNQNGLFYVFDCNGIIIGYGGMYLIIDEGDITNIAVTEQYRNRGVGQSILNKLFEEANKKGIYNFTLEVRESNLEAIKLYEKLGFYIEGKRKNFYDKPKEDGLIMWKKKQ